jgi:hypothetical protein
MVPGIGRILHRIYATYGVYLEQYCGWGEKVVRSGQHIMDNEYVRDIPLGLNGGVLNGDLCLYYGGIEGEEELPLDIAFTHKHNFRCMYNMESNTEFYFFKPLEG